MRVIRLDGSVCADGTKCLIEKSAKSNHDMNIMDVSVISTAYLPGQNKQTIKHK